MHACVQANLCELAFTVIIILRIGYYGIGGNIKVATIPINGGLLILFQTLATAGSTGTFFCAATKPATGAHVR